MVVRREWGICTTSFLQTVQHYDAKFLFVLMSLFYDPLPVVFLDHVTREGKQGERETGRRLQKGGRRAAG